MRLTEAWANVISENHALKIMLAVLAVVILSLSVATIRLLGRKPLIVERSCFSQVRPIANEEKSTIEVEAFVREALASRFDTSEQIKPGYLAPEEERYRSQEQQELKKREMKQRIVVNSISVDGKTISVDADRIISVGNVRSALSFPLVLIVGTVSRSEWNPYGLTVLQVSVPKLDAKKDGEKR